MRPESLREMVVVVCSKSVFLTILIVVVHLSVARLRAADFRAFLDHHCAECHDGPNSEGGLDLSRFPDELSVMKDRNDWRRIYEKLESREMPPPKQNAQPSETERTAILRWIEEIALRPDQQLGVRDPGKPVLRRLTRLEYNNSIRDLFGLDMDVFMFPERLPFVDKSYFRPDTGKFDEPLKISMREYGGKYPVLCPQLGLPGDNRAEHGFRNRGDAMDFSPVLLEKYLAAAREIVNAPDLPIRSAIAAELFGMDPEERQARIASRRGKQDANKGDLKFSAACVFAPQLRFLEGTEDNQGDTLREFRDAIQLGCLNSVAGVFDGGDSTPGARIVPSKGGLLRVPFAGERKTLTINPNKDLWLAGFSTADATSGGKLFCNHVKGEKTIELTFKLENADEDEGIKQLAICVLGRKKESGSVKLIARFTDQTEASVVVNLVEGPTGTRFAQFMAVPGESIKSLVVDGSNFGGDYVLLDDLGFITDGSPQPMKAADKDATPVVDLKTSQNKPDDSIRGNASPKSEAAYSSKLPRLPKDLLKAFIAKAFRRDVSEQEIQPFLAILDDASRSTSSAAEAMKAALVAVLTSPQFLFIEANGASFNKSVVPLEDWELATRLALFLWASTPDDELLDLAKSSRLTDPRVLEAQTRRMLRDPKSRELSEAFATQWLRLDQLYMAKPDRDLFKSFYSGPQGKSTLHGSMLTEALLLFETVHVEDRSILDFVAADYTWLNAGLAKHYGLDLSPGSSESEAATRISANITSGLDTTRELRSMGDATGWRRVKMPNSNRGGYVTMAAPLVVTSLPFRTSPVKRGAWLLETLFNRPPTEPKVAFAVANDTKESAQRMSIRQKFEAHRNQPACYSCHVRLDPPGFALERFNPVGQWRETDGGQVVDARGEWQGNTFDGPGEFKNCLTKNPDEFTRGFIEHLLSYALGRELEIYDMATVADIQSSARAEGWRFSRVIVEIAKSYPFTHVRR